jgi:hypothetical protein
MDYAQYLLSYHDEGRLWLVRLAPAIPEASLTDQVIACPRQRYLHHVFMSNLSTLASLSSAASLPMAPATCGSSRSPHGHTARCCCYWTHRRPVQDRDWSKRAEAWPFAMRIEGRTKASLILSADLRSKITTSIRFLCLIIVVLGLSLVDRRHRPLRDRLVVHRCLARGET